MDLLNLKLLVRAAALENLSAAGRELGLSPAAASARLGVLERDLGARLLQRTTRRVTPTADGERFLVHARLVVAELEAARAAIGRGASEPQGSLGVAASASFGRRHILPLIPEFMARYPKLTLELQLTDQLVNLVDQAMDVAFAPGRWRILLWWPNAWPPPIGWCVPRRAIWSALVIPPRPRPSRVTIVCYSWAITAGCSPTAASRWR